MLARALLRMLPEPKPEEFERTAPPRKPREAQTCWNCGEEGHLAWECPNSQDDDYYDKYLGGRSYAWDLAASFDGLSCSERNENKKFVSTKTLKGGWCLAILSRLFTAVFCKLPAWMKKYAFKCRKRYDLTLGSFGSMKRTIASRIPCLWSGE